MKLKPWFYCNDQIRKEAEKTALPTVAVATAKTTEQETILRTREGVAARQEQLQVTHGKVTVVIPSVKSPIMLIPNLKLNSLFYL